MCAMLMIDKLGICTSRPSLLLTEYGTKNIEIMDAASKENQWKKNNFISLSMFVFN